MTRMRYGIHKALEAEADLLLARSLSGITSHAAKSDILTPWKEQERRRREVYVTGGSPDPAIRRGMFKRSANPSSPHLNSRDGIAPPIRNIGGTLASWVSENGFQGSPPEEDWGGAA